MSADLKRVVRVVFQGDNETQRAFNQLQSGLNDLEGGVRSVTGPMADMADKVLKTTAALSTLATAGIALVVKEAGTWSDSFNEISTLIDATDSDLEQFKRQVLDYGASAAFALDDVNSAIYAAISAGIDYRDVLTLMADAEKLAIAGKAELGETTVALVSVLNAYGESADQAGKYSDILFETVRQGQTTLPELAGSLSQVTSLAAAADVPFETLTAVLASLTAQGMPTEQAVTALRGAIQAIVKPTSDAANLAEELGIEFNANALASRGLEGVLWDVYEATGGNVEEMARLFGNVRGLTGVLALFGQDGGDDFLQKLEAMRESAGATDTAYERMKENISIATQELINSMRASLITAGLPILEEFGSVAEALQGIFDGLRLGIDEGAFQPLYDAFGEIAQKVTAFVTKVGDALPEALEQIDWSGLIKGFEELNKALGGAFSAFFQELDPRTDDDLAQIIQTVSDSVGQLLTLAGGIIEQWQPVIRLVGDLIQEFGKMDEATARSVSNILGWSHKMETLWEQFGFFKGSLAALVAASGMSASELAWYFEKILGAGQVAFGTLKGVLLEVMGVIADLAYSSAVLMNALTFGRIDSFQQAVYDADALRHSVALAKNEAREMVFQGMDHLRGSLRDTSTDLQTTTSDVSKLGEGIESLPDEKDFKLNLDEATWNTLDQELGELMQGVDIPVSANTDTLTFRTLEEELDLLAAGVDIPADLDPEDRVPRKAADIETQLEWNARVEISEVERDIAKIEADAAIVQTQVEWEAKLDITKVEQAAETMRTAIQAAADVSMAQIQADADKWVATAGTISSGFDSIADSLSAAYGALSPDLHWEDFRRIIKRIDRELDQRDRLLDMQEETVRAQVDYLEARTQAMQDGQAMIEIDGAGLQPHLEAFMWEILSAIQTRVNEEGMDMLLGMQAGVEA